MSQTETQSSGTVQSDDLEIAYRCFGSHSQTIMLVHGWGANAETNWLQTGWIDALIEHRRVVAIDVRGHGASDKPHDVERYTYHAMSADVLAVMDALEIAQCDYLGYSMGAFIGAALLRQHAHRFNTLVLGGIGDETDETAAQGEAIARALTSHRTASDAAAGNIIAFVQSHQLKEGSQDRQALAASARAMWPDGYPLRLIGESIETASVPVLIVNGAEDHPYVDSADKLADALPDGRHITLPGADHLSAVTEPKFKQLVIQHLFRASRG